MKSNQSFELIERCVDGVAFDWLSIETPKKEQAAMQRNEISLMEAALACLVCGVKAISCAAGRAARLWLPPSKQTNKPIEIHEIKRQFDWLCLNEWKWSWRKGNGMTGGGVSGSQQLVVDGADQPRNAMEPKGKKIYLFGQRNASSGMKIDWKLIWMKRWWASGQSFQFGS